MNGLYRILGTAAAVALGGAAILAMDRLLKKSTPLYVEKTEFPERAEMNSAAAAEAAEAYAEAEAAQSAAEAAQPAAEPALQRPAPVPGGPNPNPVEAGPAVAPRDETGKFDPTRIASAEDFGDWDDLGCQG